MPCETPLAPGLQEVDRRNARMLNIKPLDPSLSDQALIKVIDDDMCSAASGQSTKTLSPALFFDSATVKSVTEIGEAVGTGDYPGFSASRPVTTPLWSSRSKNLWNSSKTVTTSVGTDLQFLDVSVVHTKNMLDDYGQKWFHTLVGFIGKHGECRREKN